MNLNEQIQVHVCNETVFKKPGLLSSSPGNAMLYLEKARLLLNSGKIAFEACACKRCFSFMCKSICFWGCKDARKLFFLQMNFFLSASVAD